MGPAPLSRFRLYAPFLALIVVQTMIVAIAPSIHPSQQGEQAAGFEEFEQAEDGTAPSAQAGPVDDGQEVAVDRDDAEGDQPADGPAIDTTDDGGAGSTPGQPEQEASDGSEPEAGAGAADAEGDTSHCTEDGLQHDQLETAAAPRCRPAFEGDNGGATYRGVTADEIRVLWFMEDTNEQVAALTEQAGVGASEEEQRAFFEAMEDFLNEYYEFYGREITIIRHMEEGCPQSPPDIPSCRAAARQAVEEFEPAVVVWPTPIYPDVFDEFAREQVITFGGWHVDREVFRTRRPFRWDLNMDGTTTMDFVGEYYCNKLAGDDATHTGEVIHPTIGPRGSVERRLGIVSREHEQNVSTAQRLRSLVADCAGEDVPIVTYDPDLGRRQEQATTNTANLIDQGVTTVVCVCDPIHPVFETTAYTRQGYFPEHLVAGMGFMDVDDIARLYDPAQWEHAFGLSHVGNPLPEEEDTPQEVWEASGRDGEVPCPCGLEATYPLLVGAMIQNAGPDFNPGTAERGMFQAPDVGGWEATGGDPTRPLVSFSEGDYTALSDVREIDWDPDATSDADGESGAYVALYEGQRFTLGNLPTSFDVPQP